jgi:hypothetical protein
MAPDDRALRVGIYDWILARGAPPTSLELARSFDTTPEEIRRALAGLKIGKTVLVAPATGEIWMAGPFSAAATPYPVRGARTRWFANCAWDMLGVAVLANEPVQIEARCTDCETPMSIAAGPTRPPTDTSVVHFLVPARRWYDDIGFT